jgi:hypothetical protein
MLLIFVGMDEKKAKSFLRSYYTSPGMVLCIARQSIHLFSVDMHPLTVS